MKPQTTIELRTCRWLGILSIACSFAGELLALALGLEGSGTGFLNRENIRRAVRLSQSRSH